MKTLSLASYPHLHTRRELATACNGSKTILLCGQASSSSKLAIAKALANENQGKKVLYIDCDVSGAISAKHNASETDVSIPSQSQMETERNLSVVHLHDTIGKKVKRLLQESSSSYMQFIVSIKNPIESKPEFVFPVMTDTLILLPGNRGQRQLKTLMDQIYDRDYTIAGVIEADTIPNL